MNMRAAAMAGLLSFIGLPAAAVTVSLNDLPAAVGAVVGSGTVIDSVAPGFGSSGQVTLNWDPTGVLPLRFWDGGYSGQSAAWCSSGVNCALDLTVSSGSSVTFNNFRLGGYPNTDREISWSIIDLATNTTVASQAAAPVSGTTGLLVDLGLISSAGFRLLFGPDGFNGGLTELTYNFEDGNGNGNGNGNGSGPQPIPLPAGVLLLFAALGGLGVASRRRSNAR
jgi:hypothetical protein